MSKFIRQAKLEVKIRKQNSNEFEKTLFIDGLRVAFNIQKNLSYSPNSGVIKVWNLSQDHRNIIKDFGDQIILYAGYQRGSGYSLLFSGDTIAVSHLFDLPNVISIFECGDGDRFVNNTRQSLSFKAGTSVETVIRSIASQLGVDITRFPDLPKTAYPLGFNSSYFLKEALTKACESSGLQWSIQNGELQIIKVNGVNNQQIFEIDASIGMIGIPQRYTSKRQETFEQGTNYGPPVGWKVQSLLRPEILPGARVNIISQYLGINQLCRVETIRHSGDTFGMDWTSSLEVTQVNA